MRGFIKSLETRNAEEEIAHNEPLPVYITLNVEWKRSNMWGLNPSVDMRWEDENGNWHFEEKAGYASGCGYDKHSAAIASALNHFKNLRYKIRNKNFKKSPYGICKDEFSYSRFEGGVGMECYPAIFRWLGYEMSHVAWGNVYDKWIIEKKGRTNKKH